MSKAVDVVNVGTNIITIVGLGIGTFMIMNNTNKAKKTIVVSSVCMSALAIGVSVFQTLNIKERVGEAESKLRDVVLRNQ